VTDWLALVRPALHGLAPYHPGAAADALERRSGAPQVIPLNRNEDLFPPFPGALEAAAAELANVWRYADESYIELQRALAAAIATTPERIVPGHGIQGLIVTLAGLLLDPGDAVVVPAPSYGLYAQICAGRGAVVRRVPLRDLRIDAEALAAAATNTGARIVWVCDPNNPTGSLMRPDEWRALLAALPDGCVAIVDEAYADYLEPAARLARERDVEAGLPVVVLRTFSKLHGLAGMRLGYAVADPQLARLLGVVQEPFNVNRPALAAALACLRDPVEIASRRAAAAAARELLQRRLVRGGAEVMPSHANFVLARVGGDDRALVCELAADEGLLLRPGSDFGLDGHVRITVGPPPIMERVAAAIGARIGGRVPSPS
jgi:histidinol-phosphate aminotransferase